LRKITLGWLRILLALMVIDEHYGYFEGLFDWFVKKQGLSLHFSFVSDGDIAVTGFFIMSGFLVAEMLESKYPSNSAKDFLHFVASRYLRIYPLYLFVFSIYVLFIKGGEITWDKIALNALLIPYGFLDLFSKDHLFNHIILTPAWTLSLDLVFYPIGYLFYKNRKFLLAAFSALILYFCLIWFIAPASSGTVLYSEDSWWNDHVYSTIEPLSISVVYDAIEGGSTARTAALRVAEDLINLFHSVYGAPAISAEIALENCQAVSDTSITLADLRKVDQWRLEFISLREDPAGDFLPSGGIG